MSAFENPVHHLAEVALVSSPPAREAVGRKQSLFTVIAKKELLLLRQEVTKLRDEKTSWDRKRHQLSQEVSAAKDQIGDLEKKMATSVLERDEARDRLTRIQLDFEAEKCKLMDKFYRDHVTSFDPKTKKHKIRVPQAQNAKSQKARDSSSVHVDDDIGAHGHAGKKHKGQSFNVTTPSASSLSSKDPRMPKLKSDLEPMGSKSSPVPGDDRLKSTSAQTLESIFAKYGDIMSDCVCKSKFVRASLLEVVCSIVQKLQYLDTEAILSELEDIENEVSDLEANKIKVAWLHDHLAKLRKIVGFKEGSFELRKTKAKCGFVTTAVGKELKQRLAELFLALERLNEAEKRVNAMRLVGRKIDDDIMEFESEEYFWKRRLDDLI